MSQLTENDDLRWRYLASIVTFLLFSTLCGLIVGASLGFVSLGAITQPFYLLYATVLSAATVYLYGEDVYQAVTSNAK